MNVFVLSSGRCGSTTFARACEHISNYSCAHESRVDLIGRSRLAYPDNHIEADNRLSWFLGRLDAAYGSHAFYVHLTREPSAVAVSYARRIKPGNIMWAYTDGIYTRNAYRKMGEDPTQAASDYLETVEANIGLFLKDKDHVFSFRLENAIEDFRAFWRAIGADGDLEAGLAEFEVLHNPSRLAPMKAPGRKGSLPRRLARKGTRILKALPEFLRNT